MNQKELRALEDVNTGIKNISKSINSNFEKLTKLFSNTNKNTMISKIVESNNQNTEAINELNKTMKSGFDGIIKELEKRNKLKS